MNNFMNECFKLENGKYVLNEQNITKLKYMRLKCNKTQKEIAKIMGFSTIYQYSKYESGEKNVKNLKYYRLESLCKALKCNINDII